MPLLNANIPMQKYAESSECGCEREGLIEKSNLYQVIYQIK